MLYHITQYGKVVVKLTNPFQDILNALIHRDYSMLTENTPVSIEMYRDRLEIISKGGLYGGGSVNNLGSSRSKSRNTALINMLELLKITENHYSGIPTIYMEMEKAGLPAPVFEDTRGVFRVILKNSSDFYTEEIDKTDMRSAVLLFCRVPRSRDEITAFTGKSRYHTMSAIIQPLIVEGKIKMTISEKPKSPNQRFVSVDVEE